MFDALKYFKNIQKKLKLTADYSFCRISSIKNLEEVILNDRENKKFFAVVDAKEGLLFEGDSSCWFDRGPVTIMLLNKLDRYPDMDGREEALSETKTIYKKIVSKLNHDKEEGVPELQYFDSSDIPYVEIAGLFANGSAGLYFTLAIDVPTNMEYDEQDWI